MRERILGRSGLRCTALGLGCGPLGELPSVEAELLVHTALDLGVTLFDVARSYGEAERALGRALRSWPGQKVVVTKGGYGVEGVEDWTPLAVARGIDEALERLGAVDVFLLHSCDRERLERGDLLEPLVEARQAGKVRAIGYAGDGAALDYAVDCRVFDVIECSVNLFDQRALGGTLMRAKAKGIGVIAKRALGNAPWRETARPSRLDAGLYWDRMQAMFDAGARAWSELAVRFAAYAPGVDSALVGTRSAVHLAAAVEAAERGPLPSGQAEDVRERFSRSDRGWEGVV
ncbi:MAG: aldo/keto reductase [Myxococcaceae bacterium]|nr:aldo/keto reductase [Myxococcaceae bacterium]